MWKSCIDLYQNGFEWDKSLFCYFRTPKLYKINHQLQNNLPLTVDDLLLVEFFKICRKNENSRSDFCINQNKLATPYKISNLYYVKNGKFMTDYKRTMWWKSDFCLDFFWFLFWFLTSLVMGEDKRPPFFKIALKNHFTSIPSD